MGCCGGGSEDEENSKVKKTWEGSLKEQKRHCTDTIMLLALIACWVIMTGVGFTACGLIESDDLKKGDLRVLFNAVDYDGRVCGMSTGVKDKPKAFYTLRGDVICVGKCPESDAYATAADFICQDGTTVSTTAQAWDVGVGPGKCMFKYASTDVMNYCIPNMEEYDGDAAEAAYLADSSTKSTAFGETLRDWGGVSNDNGDFFSMFATDVFNQQAVIFGFGIGVAVFIAFSYVTLLRLPGLLDLLIWVVIGFIFACLAVTAFMLMDLASQWEEQQEELGKSDGEIMAAQVGGWILAVFAILYVLMILYLRKRIKLAIAIVKEAGHAMTDMPLILLLPVIQTLGMVLFLIPWFIYELYLTSSGEITESTETYSYGDDDITVTTSSFEYDTNTNYAFLYMMFAFFWTSQFIIAMGQLIVAMTIACWYFTKDRSTLGNSTFMWACKASWIHAGTAAFGSLVIAIIKFIKYLLRKLQKNLEKSQNRAAIFIMQCIGCCMWCVEKCMKFLNKNAYIQTAIYGYGFCNAARSAFFLLLRNIARVYVVSKISDFILFLGKLLIPVATTFLAYLVLAYGSGAEEMNGVMGPLFLVYLLAYFVACMFNEIYGMAIQTILLCYVADEEMFENPGDRFIPGTLRNTLTSTQKAAADLKAVAPTDEKGMQEAEGDSEKPSDDVKAKPSSSVAPSASGGLM